MKAWQLDRLGGTLSMIDAPVPAARPGGVVVRMEASAMMSYMRDYVAGKLPVYHAPDHPFIPGGNGVGVVHAVGGDVWHLKPGQRVVVSSHFVANENVADPAQILVGITATQADSYAMQADWPNGTLADYALLPAATLTPADAVADLPAAQLAVAMRYVLPFGGLLRGRLAAGETIVVSGATGAYGSAAALLALALGAARVVAVGRNARALDELVKAGGGRVVPVAATGDAAADTDAIRSACAGRADIAFDMVGNASDPNLTLSALRSLRRGGRLVLMGSMRVDLPLPYTEVMLNDWEILGQFMYPRDAWRRLLTLASAGMLDLRAIRSVEFAMNEVPSAIERAASASGLECIVVDHQR
ncbi:alcohol dehydrogenase [Paraburkholderia steynii]|uniref:Alcohol dehydrogenase n=1 Tax=Paraburkholderia steynii TaxID=1245441 RepID=A0A7Z7B9J7_9BURK|nr:zinc-binding dehydrogenase [Paraburkholderia steynii]SDI28959.1 alcohol dehydrogenase [Paraburkholderia steynii]